MTALNYQQLMSIIGRRDISWLFCICCALFIIGMGLTFQAPWVDWDASDYINVAENIVDGRGIVSGWESDNIHAFWPLTVWPPFYPILIAALMEMGFSSVSAAMWVPILSFAGIVVISFFFGRDLGSPLIGYLSALCCLSMSSLWEMTRWAMTEMPYIFFSLLGLYLLLKYGNTRNNWLLVLSALFCGFGAITRYMGVTLIITGVIILLLLVRTKPLTNLKQIMVFGLISSIPVCLVFIRNIYYKGSFSGADRGTGSGSFTGVSHDMVKVLLSDLNPFGWAVSPGVSGFYGVVILLLVIAAGLLLYGVYRSAKGGFRSYASQFLTNNLIPLTYALVYVCSLILLEVFMGDIAAVQTRYLLPMYPFFVLLAVSFMYATCIRARVPALRWLSLGICSILLLGFLVGQATGSLPFIIEKGGRSYTDPVWYDEPVEEYQWVMQNLPHGAEVFSNNPRALQLHMSRLILPLPERGNAVYAQKLLTKLHPGQMIVSLKNKKSDEQYMNADEFFAYNKNFTSPAEYSSVFTSADATVYQIIRPAA